MVSHLCRMVGNGQYCRQGRQMREERGWFFGEDSLGEGEGAGTIQVTSLADAGAEI